MYNIKKQTTNFSHNNSLKHLKLYNQLTNYTISDFKQINNNIIKVYIKTTLNNIFITYNFNNKIITKSIASLGFKGKSKQTQYAYKTFAEIISNDFLKLNTNDSSNNCIVINLYLKSINKKLKPFLTLFKTNNIKINKIYDLTPIPYNGCKKRKISIKKKKKSIIKYLSYL